MYVESHIKRASSSEIFMQRFFFCCFDPASMYETGVRIKFYYVNSSFILLEWYCLYSIFSLIQYCFSQLCFSNMSFSWSMSLRVLFLDTLLELPDEERDAWNAEWKFFGSLSVIQICLRRFVVLVYICEICVTSLLLHWHLRDLSFTSWHSAQRFPVIEYRISKL